MTNEYDGTEVINLDALEDSTMCACKSGDDVPW